MQRARQLVSLTLAFSMAAPLHAYAGFGRRSSAEPSHDEQQRSSPPPSPPSPPPPHYEPPAYYPSPSYGLGTSAAQPYASERPVTPYYEPTAPERSTRSAADSGVRGTLQTDATAAQSGGLLGLRFAVEEGVGVAFDYTLALAPIEGSSQLDSIHLLHLRMLWVLVAGPGGRLRVEAGGHLARAPLVTLFAPGLGLSGEVTLGGPIGLEARAQGSLWPYTEVDVRAGLTLGSRGFCLSLGGRALYLNDNGVLGAVNADDTDDFFAGPYLGLAVLL